jgi:hypothetical protein
MPRRGVKISGTDLWILESNFGAAGARRIGDLPASQNKTRRDMDIMVTDMWVIGSTHGSVADRLIYTMGR